MSNFTFLGKTYHTSGELPEIGCAAPEFTVTKSDMGEISSSDLSGKKLILNIFPSIDTKTCAASVKAFNKLAGKHNDVQIIGVSTDLPFAQDRFCQQEKIKNMTCTSVFRHPEFGENYGVTITSGPLKGLLARAVIVIDEHGKVIFTKLIQEFNNEPDYKEVIDALK